MFRAVLLSISLVMEFSIAMGAEPCTEAYREEPSIVTTLFSSHFRDLKKITSILLEWESYLATGTPGKVTQELFKKISEKYPYETEGIDSKVFGQLIYTWAETGLLCESFPSRVYTRFGASGVVENFRDLLDKYILQTNAWLEDQNPLADVSYLEGLYRDEIDELSSNSTSMGAKALHRFQVRNQETIGNLKRRLYSDLKLHFDRYYFLKGLSSYQIDFTAFDKLFEAIQRLDFLVNQIEETRQALLRSDISGSIRILKNQLRVWTLTNSGINTFYFPTPSFISDLWIYTCIACDEECRGSESIRCNSCDKALCKGCFDQYFKVILKDRKFPIPCSVEACEGQLLVNRGMLQTMPLQRSEIDLWEEGVLRRVISENADFAPCGVPECRGYIKKEGLQIGCEYCGYTDYCRVCSQEVADPFRRHRKMTQDEENWYREKFRRGEAKKCPNCREVIEMNHGCLHMTCKKCRHEFNWTTFETWNAIRGYVEGPTRLSSLDEQDIYCEGEQR